MGIKKLVGPITEHVAGEFRAQRARLQLTYDQEASATGLAKGTVVYALKGEQAITVEAYVVLCDALQIDAARLIDEAVEATTPTPPITEADAVQLAADHTTTPTDRDRLEAKDHDDPA